jgi:hypothetical protein
MKKIYVKEGVVALIFKNGDLKRVAQKGTYWLFFNEIVEFHEVKNQLHSFRDLDVLIKNEKLNELLQVVEVKDDELYLWYKKGVFTQVLQGSRFAFWKEMTDYTFQRIDLSKAEVTEDVSRAVLAKLKNYGVVREHVVAAHEVGILFVDGVFAGELNSGSHYYWKNEQAILAKNIDLRKQRLEINGQEILTQDKANLRINIEAVYQVKDAQKAVLETREFEKQLYTMIQMVVRAAVGALTFDELMTQKEELSKEMLDLIIRKVAVLGVEVDEIGIKDIVLPGDMKEIMNQVLVAQKKAQANVIMRREETASTRSMLNTAKLMEDNPMLFKLKEMEYVEKIAERIDSITVSGGGKVLGQLKELFA